MLEPQSVPKRHVFLRRQKMHRFGVWTAASLAVAAATSIAVAQQQESPRGAPAEKVAPKQGGEVHPNARPAQQTSQAPNETTRGGRAEESREKAGETQRRNAGEAAPRETTGQKGGRGEEAAEQKTNDSNKSDRGRTVQGRSDNERNVRDNRDRTEEEGNARGARSVQDEKTPRDNRSRQTTGQGAALGGGNARNIAPEQRERIRDVITKSRGPRVDHVDFDLAVGTSVPRSIRFVAVPQSIIEIEPEWRGFDYFLVGDELVIVNPRSMQIVAVVAV
jgi:hypothetical protein